MNENNNTCSDVTMKLRQMRMSVMAAELENQFENPNNGLETFEERLTKAVNAEWESRHNKKVNRLAKKASLRYPDASLDESIYDPERELDTKAIERLSTCEWIDEKRNLLITGKSSTGKSYIGSALCVSALQKLKTVRYYRSSELINELYKAEITDTIVDKINQISKLSLLVIDDFGLMSLDINKCRNLFEVMDSRENKGSTMIISQYPVKSWYKLFANNTYADACMERMIRGAYRLEFNGKVNMRVAKDEDIRHEK